VSLAAPDWQSFYGWVIVGPFTVLLSFLGSAWALSRAKKAGMIAQPGKRQSHEVATPVGGGLGIIFSIAVTPICIQFVIPVPDFWWQKVLPGVLLLSIIGWRDDKLPVSSLLRLLIQLAVSLWLLSFIGLQFSLRDMGLFASATIAVVWLINLYNFMDGSNGMAGFQGVFAGVIMAVLFQSSEQYAMALIALTVAAACIGFLPLNFPRARVFMGDVASVPLGFIIASLAVYGIHVGSLSLPVSILIMAVFFIDATMTLFARVFRGERWYTAHAQHVYQRLIAKGWSHRRVLVVYQAINVSVVLPAIVLAMVYPQYAVVTVGLTLLLLGACWHIVNWRLGVLATVQLK
jgi:UDP-N-acetylmuramyl pentapeptide phosphotransferase/UDP-N-acetylglucosamine-1-phosphate transferase